MRNKSIYTLLFSFISCLVAHAQSPTANFRSDINSGCSPIVVNFQDQSAGNPTSWNWDFGNGATSTKQNPSTTYFTPGFYTVTLTVTNASGTNTVTKQSFITVVDPPTVDFDSDKKIGCTPYKIQFSDKSVASLNTRITDWFWDFGDGTTSTEKNPLHTYRIADKFTVTLRVTIDKGCSKTITKPNFIEMIPGVVPAFDNSIPTVCRAPATINFTNQSNGPGNLTYNWDFGDGNKTTTTSPSHTFNSTKKFSVGLAVTSSLGCSDTLWRDVLIGGFVTNFINPKVCEGKVAKFVDSSAPKPINSTWIFPDGSSINAASSNFMFPTSGDFKVTLVNDYGSCTDSVTKTVSIAGRPVINFNTPDSVKCLPPLTSNFTNLTNGVSYFWRFSDSANSNSNQTNPSHTFLNYGNYSVTLIATNSQGCVDSLTKRDYIRIRKPTISFPALPLRGCIPYTANLEASIDAVDKIATYKWDFGDGTTSNLEKPSHVYTKKGKYDITLTITTEGGCTETFTLKEGVKVGPKPTAEFTVDQRDVCAGVTLNFKDLSTPADEVDEWKWEFGDGGTSGQRDAQYMFSDTGYLDVKLTAFISGCASDPLLRPRYIHTKPSVSKFEYMPDCNNRQLYTFQDKSIDAQAWEWDFGDGSPKYIGQYPGPHTFPAGYSSYTVSLTTTNGSCVYVGKRTITIADNTPDFSASSLSGCKPFQTHLIPSAPNPGLIRTYIWDLGNGSTITNYDTYPTYQNPGDYDITLTTVDSFGCKDIKIKPKYLRVNGTIAKFSSISNQGCKGLTANFIDNSVIFANNPVVKWTWDYGDSTIKTYSQGPFQHTYDSVGDFEVKLIVQDSIGCVDSVSTPAFVKVSTLKVDWDVNRETCPKAPVYFSNKTTSQFSITNVWDFGDNNTSTDYSVNHAYKDTGFYTVKLKVRDQIGCEDSLTKTNYVQVGLPKANFDANNFVSYCPPFEGKFTNTSTFYSNSYWDLGTGTTSRQQNSSTYYINTGNYDVKLVVSSPGGCLDSVTKQVQIYNPKDATLNYGPINGCSPLQVDLEAFTDMKARFTWDFGNGNVVDTNVNKIQHIYRDFGSFTPKLIFVSADNPECKIPLTGKQPITAFGADANFTINKTLFCDSGFVYIQDSTTFNDRITKYEWDFGDGIISTDPNDTIHNYTTPGNYSVFLKITTSNGCVDSLRSKPIKVVNSPLIHIDSDSVICVNELMRHAGVFDRQDTAIVKWAWQFPNGNSASTQYPAKQKYLQAGYFTVKAIVTNGSGCTDTDSVRILVNPLPTVTLPSTMTMQAGFPVRIPATYTPSVIGYSWLPDNNTLDCIDCPQPTTVNTKFNTKYSVSFVDTNGCKNTGDVQVVVICKNANVFVPNTFSPNGDGRNDVFYVRGKGLERVKTLRVFNRWGEIVFEQKDFPVNQEAYGWKGDFKGQKANPDVYVYQVEVFCDNNEVIRFDGNVALIQ